VVAGLGVLRASYQVVTVYCRMSISADLRARSMW